MSPYLRRRRPGETVSYSEPNRLRRPVLTVAGTVAVCLRYAYKSPSGARVTPGRVAPRQCLLPRRPRPTIPPYAARRRFVRRRRERGRHKNSGVTAASVNFAVLVEPMREFASPTHCTKSAFGRGPRLGGGDDQ